MLVIGVVVALPAFLLWETRFAKIPVIPVKYHKSRTVISCMGMALFPSIAYDLEG